MFEEGEHHIPNSYIKIASLFPTDTMLPFSKNGKRKHMKWSLFLFVLMNKYRYLLVEYNLLQDMNLDDVVYVIHPIKAITCQILEAITGFNGSINIYIYIYIYIYHLCHVIKIIYGSENRYNVH
jgi:hypothetical protein